MLAGRPPFAADDLPATLALVRAADPPPLPPGIPRGLDLIRRKCLEPRPADRFPSAVELAAELDRFAAGQPVRARPTPRFVRWWRATPWSGRVGLWAWAAVAAIVAVLVLAPLNPRPAPSGTPTPEAGERTPAPGELVAECLAAGRNYEFSGDDLTTCPLRQVAGRPTLLTADAAHAAVVATPLELALFEVVPDTSARGVRFTADVRMLRCVAGERSRVGVYYAHRTPAEGVWTAFAADFSEPPEPGDRSPGRLRHTALVGTPTADEPGRAANGSAGVWASFARPAVLWRPGPWRRVGVEVRSSGVTVLWAAAPDEAPAAPVGGRTADELTRSLRGLADGSPRFRAVPTGWQPPAGWSTGGCGVYAVQGEVAVRQVRVEPLDPE